MKIEKGVFFNELDKFLIYEICKSYKTKSDISTWDIAKLFVSKKLNKPRNIIYSTNKKDIDDIYRRINFIVKKYQRFGLLRLTKDNSGKTIFELDLDNISVVKHKFSDGYKDCIIFRI